MLAGSLWPRKCCHRMQLCFWAGPLSQFWLCYFYFFFTVWRGQWIHWEMQVSQKDMDSMTNSGGSALYRGPWNVKITKLYNVSGAGAQYDVMCSSSPVEMTWAHHSHRIPPPPPLHVKPASSTWGEMLFRYRQLTVQPIGVQSFLGLHDYFGGLVLLLPQSKPQPWALDRMYIRHGYWLLTKTQSVCLHSKKCP